MFSFFLFFLVSSAEFHLQLKLFILFLVLRNVIIIVTLYKVITFFLSKINIPKSIFKNFRYWFLIELSINILCSTIFNSDSIKTIPLCFIYKTFVNKIAIWISFKERKRNILVIWTWTEAFKTVFAIIFLNIINIYAVFVSSKTPAITGLILTWKKW